MTYDKILAIYRSERGETQAIARNTETKEIEVVDITETEFDLFHTYLPIKRRSVYPEGEYVAFDVVPDAVLQCLLTHAQDHGGDK